MPLHKWLQAIYLTDGVAKFVRPYQLQKILNVSFKTAAYMTERLRAAALPGYKRRGWHSSGVAVSGGRSTTSRSIVCPGTPAMLARANAFSAQAAAAVSPGTSTASAGSRPIPIPEATSTRGYFCSSRLSSGCIPSVAQPHGCWRIAGVKATSSVNRTQRSSRAIRRYARRSSALA